MICAMCLASVSSLFEWFLLCAYLLLLTWWLVLLFSSLALCLFMQCMACSCFSVSMVTWFPSVLCLLLMFCFSDYSYDLVLSSVSVICSLLSIDDSFIWSIHLSSTLYSHSISVVCIPPCLVSLFNLVVNLSLSLIFTLSISGVMGISICMFVWTSAFSLCLCLVLDSLVLFCVSK